MIGRTSVPWALAAAIWVLLAGCESASSAVARQPGIDGRDASTNAAALTRAEASSAGSIACDTPTVLEAGETLHGQTAGASVASAACRASDAPQRFFLIRIPASHRAVVTVTPTSSSAFTPVVRLLSHCAATHCETDHEAAAPGQPVTLTYEAPATWQGVFYKIISVSARASDELGRYDISFRLEPLAPLDACQRPDGLHPLSLPQDTLTAHLGRRAMDSEGNTFDLLEPVEYLLHVPERTGVQIEAGGPIDTMLHVYPICSGNDRAMIFSDNRDWFSPDARIRTVLEPGDYRVAVSESIGSEILSHRGQGDFTLSVGTFEPVDNTRCDRPAELDPEHPALGVEVSLGGDQRAGACAFSTQPARWYAVTIPAHQRARVQATPASGLPPGLAIDPPPVMLAAMDGCTVHPNACLRWSSAAHAALDVDNPGDTPRRVMIAASAYYYIEYRSPSAYATVDLSVAFRPIPTTSAPNAACAGAIPLGVGTPLDETAELSSNPFEFLSRYYAVRLPAGQRLTATVRLPRTNASNPGIALLASCAEGAPTLASAFVPFPPGDPPRATLHYANRSDADLDAVLALSWFPPSASVSYRLSAELNAVPPTASNAACAGATEVTDGTVITGAQPDAGSAPSPCNSQFGGSEYRTLFYRATVPPGYTARFDATANPGLFVSLGRVVDCAARECRDTVGCEFNTLRTATLAYTNRGAAPEEVVIAANGRADDCARPRAFFTGNEPPLRAFDLAVRLIPPAENTHCAAATRVVDGGVVREFGDRGAPGTTVCTREGPESLRYYTATVPPGHQLTAVATARGSRPIVRLFAGCDASRCLDGGPGLYDLGRDAVSYLNTRGVPLELTLVVASSGSYELHTSIRPPEYRASTRPTRCDDMASATVLDRLLRFRVEATSVPLPFAFDYFGRRVGALAPHTDGRLEVRLAEDPTPPSDQQLDRVPLRTMYPFRESWARAVDRFSGLRVATFGSLGDRHTTFEWAGLTLTYNGAVATFQAQLYEATGAIEFHYCDIESAQTPNPRAFGGQSLIGIVGDDIARRVLHSYYDDGPLSPATALRFTPAR